MWRDKEYLVFWFWRHILFTSFNVIIILFTYDYPYEKTTVLYSVPPFYITLCLERAIYGNILQNLVWHWLLIMIRNKWASFNKLLNKCFILFRSFEERGSKLRNLFHLVTPKSYLLEAKTVMTLLLKLSFLILDI